MYLEKPASASGINHAIDAVWQFQADKKKTSVVFPDACVDIIIKQNKQGSAAIFCGVMNRVMQVSHHAGDIYYGVRFKPGFAWAFVQQPICTTLNQVLPLHNILARCDINDLNHDISSLASFDQWIQAYVLQQLDQQRFKALEEQTKRLGEIGFGEISATACSLNLSRRQFLRRFQTIYGISPREFSNIKRLNTLRAMRENMQHMPLAELALMLGFYDQAHMNHHIKKLSGFTPKVLMSQSYNT